MIVFKACILRFVHVSGHIFLFKVVDSCRTCSTKSSDTFRSFFVCGKEQESRKKICYHRAKKIHLPKGV